MTFFDEGVAARYDDPADPMNAPAAIEPVAEALAVLADGGPALEFAIGTGRIAIPLQRIGVEVHGIEISEPMLDVVNQRPTSHHYWLRGGEAATFSSTHRWGWPAEYDLMARIAGLSLDARWGGWGREPFTDESTSHVSVWRKD